MYTTVADEGEKKAYVDAEGQRYYVLSHPAGIPPNNAPRENNIDYIVLAAPDKERGTVQIRIPTYAVEDFICAIEYVMYDKED